MQPLDNVVNRIIDLDTLAERVRTLARESAETVRGETQRRLAEEKAQLERQISERIAQIESEAMTKRTAEIAAVREEFANEVKAVESVPTERMTRVVDMVVSRIKGASE